MKILEHLDKFFHGLGIHGFFGKVTLTGSCMGNFQGKEESSAGRPRWTTVYVP